MHYILYSIFYIPYSIKRGFTILEVIVAIFVLTVAVGGSFVLIQQTLIAASLAQSKLAAHYLAQEGIEIVRNIRDTNWLKQRSDELNFFWDTDIIPLELPLGESRDCIADYNDDGLSDFVEEKPLNLDDNGFYSYAYGDPTPFERKITITKLDLLETSYPDDYKLRVRVRVEWSERGRDHWVEASEDLYNWGGYY